MEKLKKDKETETESKKFTIEQCESYYIDMECKINQIKKKSIIKQKRSISKKKNNQDASTNNEMNSESSVLENVNQDSDTETFQPQNKNCDYSFYMKKFKPALSPPENWLEGIVDDDNDEPTFEYNIYYRRPQRAENFDGFFKDKVLEQDQFN